MKDPVQKIIELQAICRELGWSIAMDDSSDIVKGLIIGKSSFIEEIMTGNFDIEDYDIYSTGEKDTRSLN